MKREWHIKKKITILIILLMLIQIAIYIHIQFANYDHTIYTLHTQLAQSYTVNAQLAHTNQLLQQANVALANRMNRANVLPTHTGYTVTWHNSGVTHTAQAVGIVAVLGKIVLDGLRMVVAFA